MIVSPDGEVTWKHDGGIDVLELRVEILKALE
jgi:hypothetical protein